MREINISVYDDKTIKASDKNLGNKLDNGITKLIFNFDGCKLFSDSLTYKYLAIKNKAQKNFYLIDITEDLYFIVSDFYTKLTGEWELLVILSNFQIVEGTLENDGTNFVSNSVKMTITNNFLNDDFIIRENEEAI